MAVFTHSPKKSKHIKSFSYDDKTHVLSVTFDHGRLKEAVTEHRRVPADVAHSFLKWAEAGHSAGSYYHRYISSHQKVDLT